MHTTAARVDNRGPLFLLLLQSTNPIGLVGLGRVHERHEFADVLMMPVMA
jgi:hypothetical protein